jgi:ComF family protein
LRGLVEESQRFLLDLLFPPRCAGCGSPGVIWCLRCNQLVRRLLPRTCSRCGRRFPAAGRCRVCPPSPDGLPVTAIGHYGPPLDRALTHLKYRPDRALAEVFAGWLAEAYRLTGWTADCIVSVPLGRRRERQRGYNQVALIAQALDPQLEMPALPTALRRTRETRSQVGLTPIERQRNVSDAFSADPAQVRDHSPLLLDDVYTTGATLTACARALERAGAIRVYGLTLARA